MGSKDMLQSIPFLQGKYLYYGEYFALVGWLVILALFILTTILSRITRMSVQIKPNVKGQALLKKNINNLTGLESIFETISIFFKVVSVLALQILWVPLSGFNVISVWVSIGWAALIGFLGTRSLIKQIYVNSNGSRLMSTSLVFILALGSAFALPLLFDGGCLCFYQSNANLIPWKDTIGLDTKISRAIWGRHWCQDGTKPCHVYTTLPTDPTTSIFINVHTSTKYKAIELNLLKVDPEAQIQLSAQMFHYDDLESVGQRNHHVVHLSGLTPDTLYEFTISQEKTVYEKIFRFRTQPTQSTKERPIIIVNGGDVGNSHMAQKIWRQVALLDPDVISLGGDVSYDNNLISCYWTHDSFLENYEFTANAIGRLVPMILIVGNHDVGLNPKSNRPVRLEAGTGQPLIFSYYPQGYDRIPQVHERKSFNVHRFGGVLFFSMDSAYVNEYGGDQGQLIDDTIAKYPESKVRFATYHVPLYSTCYNEQKDQTFIQDGKNEWIARFDKYHFQTVYENHVHTYKRTKLLKNGEEHPNGTLYLGDGNWGADFEYCTINDSSFIANHGVINSIWLTVYDGEVIIHSAINDEGQVFDRVLQALE